MNYTKKFVDILNSNNTTLNTIMYIHIQLHTRLRKSSENSCVLKNKKNCEKYLCLLKF